MKRFIALFFLLGMEFFLIPSLFSVSAQGTQVCPTGFENLCKINFQGNQNNVIGNVIQILIIIAIVVSVIFLIIGGIRWIMSGGDKAKVEQARSTIIAAIVGLVVSILAYAIVALIVSMLTGNFDIKNIKIPRLID